MLYAYKISLASTIYTEDVFYLHNLRTVFFIIIIFHSRNLNE